MASVPPRTLTAGFAALGLLSLTGCAVATAAADPGSSGSGTSPRYSDGTYTVDAGYQAPSGIESITVDLTLSDGTVTAVTVTGRASDREAREFQQRFGSAIAGNVVGRHISTLVVTRVAGASLTSNGFNTALDEIRSQAG